ncbi:MAG TPA: hypothetical protein VIG24_05290 [Acidimicrobiia bacterium]
MTTQFPTEEWKPLIDAQTSGGLLVALPEENVDRYVASVPGAARIGQISADGTIRVT